MSADELLEIASVVSGFDRETIARKLDAPNWADADRGVEFWESEIPKVMRDNWGVMPLPAKIGAFIVAEHVANSFPESGDLVDE